MNDTTTNTGCNAQSSRTEAQNDPWVDLGAAPTTVHDAARVYDALGWHPVPIIAHNAKHRKRGKKPAGGDEWQKQNIGSRFGNLDEHFPADGHGNIGVMVNFPFVKSAGRLVDVDLDRPEAVSLGPFFLDATLKFGREGALDSHWLYDATGETRFKKWTLGKSAAEDDDGAMIVELRGGGNLQTVFPPSIHGETHRPIRWTNWGVKPTTVPFVELERRCALIAIGTVLAQHWVKGQRYHLSLAVSRFLLERGVGDDEARDIVRAVCAITASTDRSDSVAETRRRLDGDQPATGTPTLVELIGDDVKRIERWIGELWKSPRKRRANGAAQHDDDFVRHPKTQTIVARSGHNVRVALEKMGVSVTYDEFADLTLIEGLKGFGPALDDAALHRVMLDIERQFGFLPQKDLTEMVLGDEARRNRSHPVRVYLVEAEAARDPTLRLLDDWLVRYGGAPDTPYVRAVGRLFLVAAVRRIRQPGCKFDEILVLVSEVQGLLKSTAVATLAVREGWYSDGLRLNADSKVIMEQTRGKWIIELPDMTGHDAKKINEAKAFASRKTERARLAWHRFAEDMPRSCVFIATTNDAKFLVDPTGNRRFWPVTVGRFDVDGLNRDLDQLWGEAAAAETADESIRLDPKLYEAAAVEQRERVADDPWLDLLAERLTDAETGWRFQGYLRSTDAWNLLNLPIAQAGGAHTVRLGHVMRQLGFERRQRRFGGDPVGVYARGDDDYQLPMVTDVDRRWYVSVPGSVIDAQIDAAVRRQVANQNDADLDFEAWAAANDAKA